MENRIFKISMIACIAIIVIISIIGFFIGNHFYDMIINRNTDKGTILGNHKKLVDERTEIEKSADEQKAQELAWLEASDYTDEYLMAFDELELHAYKITNPQAGDKWMLIAHGYDRDATKMLKEARIFYDKGFNILLPDARGHGKSTGDYVGMGWHERRDIVDWTKMLAAENANAKIALYGVSMGASTVMMASGEQDLPEQVRLVIEDCGYASTYDQIGTQLGVMFNVPAFPILDLTSLVTRFRAGYWLAKDDVVHQIAASHTPTLFIHGDADSLVPVTMLDKVYDVTSAPKEKLIVAGAEHGKAVEKAPELYWQTVDTFIAQYLADEA